MNFSDYDRFVEESGRTEASRSERVIYAALKLNGEAGEVAELVGKSMRANTEFAPTIQLEDSKLLLELGDVLWYVARLAALHGFTLEEVAWVNQQKLQRRKSYGKDAKAELEMAQLFKKFQGVTK